MVPSLSQVRGAQAGDRGWRMEITCQALCDQEETTAGKLEGDFLFHQYKYESCPFCFLFQDLNFIFYLYVHFFVVFFFFISSQENVTYYRNQHQGSYLNFVP